MKVRFEGAEALRAGIGAVAEDLGITLSENAADLTVRVEETAERVLTVTLSGNEAAITYGDGKARFFRGLAILADWVKKGETKKTLTETPAFATNGGMLDLSDFSVMNVDSLKVFFRKMALMGLNTCWIYSEDTYEVPELPYFGHMRGRYSREEIKEMDAYALDLGIELVPCIQTLGHLSTYLRWAVTGPYRDTSFEMLAGAEETYEVIGYLLKAVSECFTSRKVHIGMDETSTIGLGAYLKKNGYRDNQEIYVEHLKRVVEMVRGMGLEPLMWSDRVFRLAGRYMKDYNRTYDPRIVFSEEEKQKIPAGVRPVFWEYGEHGTKTKPMTKEYYAEVIKRHREAFKEEPIFAGGIWLWSGFCPLYSRSEPYSVMALEACRETGLQDVIATIWDVEALKSLSLPGLALYADIDYHGCFDEASVEACFERACGVSYRDMMLCELPDLLAENHTPVTRVLLYNDPLLGLFDAHLTGYDIRGYYTEVARRLKEATPRAGMFRAEFETLQKLSDLLAVKGDFGIRLTKAYRAGDREALKAMLAECDTVIEKMRAYAESHRAVFMRDHKPFGWHIFDIRYGGILARFDTAKMRIADYLAGRIPKIEELEEDRLRYDGKPLDTEEPAFYKRLYYTHFQDIATTGLL